MTQTAISPGQLVAGRYRVDSFIGSSDISEVFGATDMQGGRECALKLFVPELRNVPQAFSAFQELSRNVAAAAADSVVRATDFGVDPALGRPFVVSERIAFPSVAALVMTGGPVDPILWGAALTSFARALDAALAANVAHGDLKPQNLFFSPEHPGWARVADFGVLALRAQCRPASGVAPLGWAPVEQVQNAAASPTADVFALGLITFYALTGRHYLRSMWQANPDPQAVLAELWAERAGAREHARAQGADLPESLDAWFALALARDPALRFARAGAAAEAFVAALPGSNPAVALAPSAPMPTIAAAVAAPLLFQDLPRLPDVERSGATSQSPRPAPFAEPQRSSSRPPGYTAPRASSTEHVAGLPPKPPVALFLAVGGVLAVILTAAVIGVVRWAFSDDDEAAPSSSASALASADTAPPLAPAPIAAAPLTPSLTGARLECIPESCDWIVCDGEKVKTGTLELKLEPGRHNCSASRYGHRTAAVAFDVEPGKTTKVVFELLPAKPTVAAPPARKAPAPVKANASKTAAAKASAKAAVASKASATSSKSTPAKTKPSQ